MNTVNYSVSKWRSRVDWWLLVIILLAVPGLLLTWPMLEIRQFQLHQEDIFTISATCVMVFLILRFTIWPCEYTLHQDHLEIVCGKLMRKTIYYADIKWVRKNHSIRIAPTLSFVRVKIAHKNTSSQISPRNRNAFIKELRQRCRNLQQDDDQHSEMRHLIASR